jgi:hypothetical protein
VAALLLTFIFWFMVWAIGAAENSLLMFINMQHEGVDFAAVQAEQSRKSLTKDKVEIPKEPLPTETKNPDNSDDKPKESQALNVAYRIVYGVKTFLPKTTETIFLLERSLTKFAGLENKQMQQNRGVQEQRMVKSQMDLVETLRARSIAWVLGTSLGFEAVVLCLAAWAFCRRDY